MIGAGRWRFALRQMMLALAALAIVLAAVIDGGTIWLMLAFLVLSNLILRLYYLTWPVFGPILFGLGDEDQDEEADPSLDTIRDELLP